MNTDKGRDEWLVLLLSVFICVYLWRFLFLVFGGGLVEGLEGALGEGGGPEGQGFELAVEFAFVVPGVEGEEVDGGFVVGEFKRGFADLLGVFVEAEGGAVVGGGEHLPL